MNRYLVSVGQTLKRKPYGLYVTRNHVRAGIKIFLLLIFKKKYINLYKIPTNILNLLSPSLN